jgi:Big-like domain-containing protein/carboxypeptidase family protein/beta-propeller repeat-containing protein/IPT/TIG domain-containing protein
MWRSFTGAVLAFSLLSSNLLLTVYPKTVGPTAGLLDPSMPAADLSLRTVSFQPKPRPKIKTASALDDKTTSFSKLKNNNDAAATEANREAKKQIAENYGRLPLSFEMNEGQIDPEVKFFSRGAGYGLYLTSSEAMIALNKRERLNSTQRAKQNETTNTASEADRTRENPASRRTKSQAVRIKMLGANRQPAIEGLDELPGKTNYFIGDDPAKWQTDVLNYAKVKYTNVYPGVDLLYYGNAGQLEYDFIVAPGADPRSIKLHYDGAKHLSLAENGDLVLKIAGGEIRQHKPVVFQELENGRHEIDCRYIISKTKQVTFEIGEFDRSKQLIIDPILSYSTYLGGNGDDFSSSIVVDSSGNAYVVGDTTSTNFPRVNPFQTTFAGGFGDIFVTKINSAGSALVYSTYVGGTSNESGYDIRVDSNGIAYVSGESWSTNFPTVSAFQQTRAGQADGVWFKLSAAGNSLLYSTYFGGSANDVLGNIEVDENGAVYLSGYTDSSNFPLANALQSTLGGGDCGSPCPDAFVTKFNAAGSALVYSTFVGGFGEDRGAGLTVDASGNAYISGTTRSTSFPTLNPIQASSGGDYDVFVAALNSSGSGFLFSTYIGGQQVDFAGGITRDSNGNIYVTGSTRSTNFPTLNAFDSTLGGTGDAFLLKLNSLGTALVYSTYLGGSTSAFNPSSERGAEVVVNSSGQAYVAGLADSSDFPTQDALDATFSGTDAFVTQFSADGSSLVFSTCMGGTNLDYATGLALGPNDEIYLFGDTLSTNFTTAAPFQASHGGGSQSSARDTFVVKISAEEGFSISGVIADSGSNPISSVQVTLAGRQNQIASTNASGFYSFPHLATGNYTVTPSKANHTFAPTNQTFNNLTANQTANFTGTVAQVTISGKVKDGNGAGVSGVTVSLTGSQTGSQLTDATGNYIFTNLNAGGSYTVTPTRGTDTFVPGNKVFNNLSSNQTTDFTLVYRINGQITDSVGTPVSGFTVSLTGAQSGSTVTDASGNYTFINLPGNASYTLTPSKPGFTVTYTFTPTNQALNPLNANAVVNFSFTTATSVTLFPIADSHVQDGVGASNNFGAVTPLLLKTANQADQRRDVYLKFDLSSVGRQILNAKLRIHAALSVAGSVNTAAYSVTDVDWQESAITWANKPARNGTAISGSTVAVTSMTFATYVLDITSYILAEKNAGRNIVSLALHNPSNSTPEISLNSREAGSNKPQLFLTTSDNNNAAPSVSLASPTAGAIYTAPGSVPLTANASDADGSISKVVFYAGTNQIAALTASPYNATWSNVPAGSYSITAIATDNNGLSSISTAAQINVKEPNGQPAVSLTAPLNNAIYPVGSNINLAATASDVDGSVTQVQFFVGGNLLGTDMTAPYTFAWNNVAAGAYTLTAQATDNLGLVRISDPVSFNVVWQSGVSSSADAYVRDGSTASTNFGTSSELHTQQGSAGSNRESYLRFDLNAVNNIAYAKLRVYGRLSDASGTNVPIGAYSVSSTPTWGESGSGSITWNLKPNTGATALSSATVTDNVNRWYEFDVSSYIKQEKFEGRSIISIALKNLAASSPFAIFNSREAAGNRPQLLLWTASTRNALFAVGSSNLNAGDTATKTRLESLGYTVTVEVANNGLVTADADGKALIVISSTVTAKNVGDKFKFVPVPVVSWEPEVFDNFGMTGVTLNTHYGTTSTTQTQLDIATASHAMAAGLSGTVTVTTTATNFTWGSPNVNAVKVATVTSDAAKSVIFGYESGVTMIGMDAPARRVGLFMTDLTTNSLNSNGQALFDAAIRWAAEVLTAPTITTLTPNSGPVGTLVTITGFNFGVTQGSSTLTLNGLAMSPSSWSDKSITALVPAFASTGSMVITINGVASNAQVFTVADVDSDADGLPDWWEIQFFGNLNQTAGADPDGDGVTNLQEFQQGRNPTVNALFDDSGVNLKLFTPLASPTP